MRKFLVECTFYLMVCTLFVSAGECRGKTWKIFRESFFVKAFPLPALSSLTLMAEIRASALLIRRRRGVL